MLLNLIVDSEMSRLNEATDDVSPPKINKNCVIYRVTNKTAHHFTKKARQRNVLDEIQCMLRNSNTGLEQ